MNGTAGDEMCIAPTQCKPAVRCHNPAATATAELHDGGGLFHANLLAHASEWAAMFERGGDGPAPGSGGAAGPLQIELRYDQSEGSRLVDMGRATIASAMSTFVGDRPNYGDGANCK